MGYCERCGGNYDFEGICENCGDDEEWSWNTPHNQSKVKCENCGHEIYKARRYCFVCGAKNRAAFEIGENYCPRCGNAFEDGICPNCGKSLSFFQHRDIKPEEKRYCQICGNTVSKEDHFCLHCGNENYIIAPSKTPVKAASKPAPKQAFSKKEKPVKYVPNIIDEDDDAESPIKLNTTLWIILGVISTFFCCFVSGIVTTVFAVKAKRLQSKRKFHAAYDALEMAEGWFALTLIIGVIEIIVGIVAAIILK